MSPHKAMQIVYARAEKTKLVLTGRTIRRDHNYFPEMAVTWEGRAGMWLRHGTEADVAKAKASLAAEGYTVLTYPTTERDPLGKARDAVVKMNLALNGAAQP